LWGSQQNNWDRFGPFLADFVAQKKTASNGRWRLYFWRAFFGGFEHRFGPFLADLVAQKRLTGTNFDQCWDQLGQPVAKKAAKRDIQEEW